MAVDRPSYRNNNHWGALIWAVSWLLPGVAISQAASVPPPPEQFAAECSAPVYATDKLICESDDLRHLDAEMSELWWVAQDRKLISGFWIEPQADWFRRRSLCAFQSDHEGCVLAAYAERIAILYLLQFPPRTRGPEITCKGGGEVDYGTIARGPNLLLVMDPGAHPRIVASTTFDTNWRPFVSAVEEERRFRIERIDGATLDCALSEQEL